jgi:RNA polymerase sigma factor (sigma-70 family)
MQENTPYSDEWIIQSFADKALKNKAFEAILDQYQQKVYWHVRRMVISHDDADDVCQNTFIKVWENLHQFKGQSKLYTWIYRIATNEALSFLNSKKANQSLEDTPADLLNHLHNPEYFNGNHITLKLQEALLQLPEKQRLVFNMKYFENMKYEEMSDVLDTSVGALKASYHHAVKKIESYLIQVKPLN